MYHTEGFEQGNSKCETKEESDIRIIYKRGIENQKERNEVTKNVGTIRGGGGGMGSPKQCQTSAKDLTIELAERREFPYHRLD